MYLKPFLSLSNLSHNSNKMPLHLIIFLNHSLEEGLLAEDELPLVCLHNMIEHVLHGEIAQTLVLHVSEGWKLPDDVLVGVWDPVTIETFGHFDAVLLEKCLNNIINLFISYLVLVFLAQLAINLLISFPKIDKANTRERKVPCTMDIFDEQPILILVFSQSMVQIDCGYFYFGFILNRIFGDKWLDEIPKERRRNGDFLLLGCFGAFLFLEDSAASFAIPEAWLPHWSFLWLLEPSRHDFVILINIFKILIFHMFHSEIQIRFSKLCSSITICQFKAIFSSCFWTIEFQIFIFGFVLLKQLF